MKHDLELINAAIASGDLFLPPIGSEIVGKSGLGTDRFPATVVDHVPTLTGEEIWVTHFATVRISVDEVVRLVSVPKGSPPFGKWKRMGKKTINLFESVFYASGLDAYGLHQLIWRAFGGFAPGTPRPFLFVERDRSQGRGRVEVRSVQRPNLLEISDDVQLVGCNERTYSISTGDCLGFRLVANPTKAEVQPDGRPSKRRSLSDYASVGAWLTRQGARHGFGEVTCLYTLFSSERWRDGHGRSGVHGRCEMGGQLTVTDSEAFTAMLVEGIGAAKAFGFGLMEVARPGWKP